MASSSNSSEIMVSTSSSSIPKSFKYDVFLSFRGEDTRKNFVGHLYQALKQKGIATYKDDETIEQGERINDQLLKSIQESRFFIIVFSKTYASSSWCLDELVKIIECQKKIPEQTAYPVFFDVEPTQVRKQNGPVGEAFSKHENQEAAGKWRDAMKELADLAGWELKATANGDESKLIQMIVDAIFIKKNSTLSNTDGKLVGMETRISDVLSSLEIGTEDVRMIGIKGMGGGGKTTLARAVYDQISNHFEGKSFVENVREVSQRSGLKKLQKQILKDVLNKEHINLSSVHDGKNMLKATMCCRKILVVLDDVDRIEQLEALAGEPDDWFKSGSRIIITTRDDQVLKAHGVKFVHDVNLLSHEEAICLFSRCAFRKEIPVQGYEEVSGQVVEYANGLPLTIKVLGSLLYDKLDKREWVDVIKRLKEIPLQETMEKLELSYMSLEDDYKEMFLDIACILKGEKKGDAITILECCGFHARNGLKVLEQRSLVTISPDKYGRLVFGMHDHIEEMGKNIVRREHPDEPNKHSRLWINKEIEDILANDKGTEATRCLKLNKSRVNARIVMKGLGKMKNLRYLDVNFASCDDYDFATRCLKLNKSRHLNDTTQYFPNSLKYLKCWGYPFLYLPKTLIEANNLVGLEMEESDRMVQLWKGRKKKVLIKLKFLSLSWLELKTFDFGMTPNLEMLSLDCSFNIKELCMPVTCQKLKHLDINDSKLRTFDLGLTPNLERLSLKNSCNLVELCMPVTCQKLKHLEISHSKLKLRTFDLGLTPNLETLSLAGCADFVELIVPDAYPNLKFLNLSKSRLRSLDLELIPNLERLDLNHCSDFEELHVSAACPNLKFLDLYGSRLRSLDLELIPNLERLDIAGCDKLVEIKAPDGCLNNVVYLNLYSCLRFTHFVFSNRRSDPKVSCSSANLRLVGKFLDSCPLHPNSNLPKLQFDFWYYENLLPSVGNIEKLISFGLCSCTDFKKFSDIICSLQCLKELTLECDIPEFPKNLGQLECLEKLSVRSREIKHLPDSICMLKRLKSLEVNIVDNYFKSTLPEDLLEKLPEDLGQLECLEKLCVSSRKIEYLPDSICMLKRLKWLDITGCCRLGKLPEDIGQLKSLKRLYLWGSTIRHLPDSICMLKHLKYLDLDHCALLEKLPEDLGRLECLEELDITDTGISHLPQSIFGLKGLYIAASSEVLQLYDFPSEIETATSSIRSWFTAYRDSDSLLREDS